MTFLLPTLSEYEQVLAELAEVRAERDREHAMLMRMSGALVDARTVVVDPPDKAIRELTAERDAAIQDKAEAIEAMAESSRVMAEFQATGEQMIAKSLALEAERDYLRDMAKAYQQTAVERGERVRALEKVAEAAKRAAYALNGKVIQEALRELAIIFDALDVAEDGKEGGT